MKTIRIKFLKKILSVNVLIFSLLISHQVQANNIYSGDIIYMTKKGDTIENIAHKFNLTPSAIYDANWIDNQNQFTEKMKLIIPTSRERYKTEISECRGTFLPNLGVHIIVNWDSNMIKVNGIRLKLNDVIIDKRGNGITTTPYQNKLGYSVFYFIVKAHPPYQGDFIVQVDSMSRRVITSTSLSCTKSFDMPFTEKMLNKNSNT